MNDKKIYNEKLAEQFDHGHYQVCRTRMHEINTMTRRLCYYTLGAALFIAVTSIPGIRYPLISALPYGIFGNEAEIAAIIFQILEAALIALVGVLQYGHRKWGSVVLFVLYLLMTAITLFSGTTIHSPFSFGVGAIGIFFSFKALPMYLDYLQLKGTEGFPEFDQRETEQEENRIYQPQYGEQFYSKKNRVKTELPASQIPSPEESDIETSGDLYGKGTHTMAEMDEI